MAIDETTAGSLHCHRHIWLLAAVLAGMLAIAFHARAQDDGPRVYQLTPEGAKALTVFAVAKRGNEGPKPARSIWAPTSIRSS